MRPIHELARNMVNTMLEGKRVRLISTTDPYTRLVTGDTGTVDSVDDAGTVHVKWDNGSLLGLIPNEDRWTVIHDDDATDTPDRCYCSGNCECAYCLRQIELAEREEGEGH